MQLVCLSVQRTWEWFLIAWHGWWTSSVSLSLEIQSMPKNPRYALAISVRTLTAALAPSLLTTWLPYVSGGMKTGNVRKTTSTACYIVVVLLLTHYQVGWQEISLAVTWHPQVYSASSVFKTGWALMRNCVWLTLMPSASYVPSNPKHYWRYRMHVSIEDLMQNTDFRENLTELVCEAGREW